ncbi:MAG: hypothetical protein QG604_584 [Candidatus Dependentiae bacterium]|nr:hypothetical protein [Candidatus Dependentiae bacterium]
MFALLLLGTLCSILANMTMYAGGKAKNSDDETITFISLGTDQGIYKAMITDCNQEIPVTKLSFAGETTLDGVKKEFDNSISKISLSELESIVMLDPLYISKRYPQAEFCAVAITTTSGISEEMLMPRNLLICAQDRESNIRKSWPLRKISAIHLKHGLEDNTSPNRVHYRIQS